VNILIDLLPTTVEIDNVDYQINSNFRASMLFEILMQDDELKEEDKIMQTLELFYPVIPKNANKAIEQLLWFYRCGKAIKESSGRGNGKNSQIYSYDYDDDYIYSAFLAQYNLDLQDIDYLHWWKFKAMFKSLKEDNEIVKIMGYRAMDISKIKDKEQKEFYRNMKKLYEIPISESEKEKINLIEKALMSDGDLRNVL
jgi:hypothetical protein